MKSIPLARFNAYAGFCRSPSIALSVRELAWYESDSRDVLAVLILDRDREYSGAILAGDLMHRFRWVHQTEFYAKKQDAVREVRSLMNQVELNLTQLRVQGDETEPVDFFTPVAKEKRLHATFRELSNGSSSAPAREMITHMMRWYENQDGNYVEQFQTTGFDARIWELYLFATLVESGYSVSQPAPAPDFLAQGLGGQFYIEATTVNPSVVNGKEVASQKPQTEDEVADYVDNYLPVRFAGPLTAKLEKRYWENAAVGGSPLVFAIQDFHDVMSMTYSGASLPSYLYGFRVERVETEEGPETISEPIAHHSWKGKVVRSGFFDLPDSEHISAVIFNGSGTLSKFNRMGVSAGFGEGTVRLIHAGRRFSSDGRAVEVEFSEEVTEGYEELWIDGMNVYHNPNALHRLNPQLLPGAAHHWKRDEGIASRFPYGHLTASRTGGVVVH